MTTAAPLPPLESLHRRSAKRTRDIFASESGDTLQEDEARRVYHAYILLDDLVLILASSALGHDWQLKSATNTATTKNFHPPSCRNRELWAPQNLGQHEK